MISGIKFDPSRRKFLKAASGWALLGAVAAVAPILPPWFDARAATTIFVSAVDGNNADTGADWTNAKQTVAGALAIAVTGDIILVDNAGTFTASAAITWTPPAGNVAIISVNRAGGDAWAAGAVEAVGASSNAFNVAGAAASAMFVYGMTINGGSNAASACDINLVTTVNVSCYFETRSCTFDLKSTTLTTNRIFIGPTNGATSRLVGMKFYDCTFICSGSRSGDFISLDNADIEIVNPVISCTGATKPSALFVSEFWEAAARVVIRDGTLAGYNVSGGAYFNIATQYGSQIVCSNLILDSTPTVTTGSWPAGSNGSITLRNVDSGDTDYIFSYHDARGTLTVDIAIYKDGGASFNGQNVSWKIVTTAAASEFNPFVTPLLSIWDTLTSAQTATFDIIRDSATNLTNRDIWPTLDYAASATTTRYTAASGRNANPFTGTGADWSASGATWTGVGGFSNTNEQVMSIAFTAARDGLLQGRVYVGVASATLYLDAKVAGVS